MYLSTHQRDVLSRVMTTLAEPHEESEIRARVGTLMLDLLGAQHYASFVWDDEAKRFDHGVRINMDSSNLARYESHFQYHDPITFRMQPHRRAVRVTDVLPQAALRRTEFFNDFLQRDGLHWGVNLYAWSGERNIGDMRIWRDRRRDDFDRDDLALLDLVRPAFVAALERCRATRAPSMSVAAPSLDTPLSPRESEVARFAVAGLGDKEIARRLGLSVTTVRTHVKHVYEKLHVHSRLALAERLRR